jgi:hypothetical protein
MVDRFWIERLSEKRCHGTAKIARTCLAPEEENGTQLFSRSRIDDLRPILPRDAFHIAIAAVNGVDYLLTWNCKHIANATLRGRIEKVCRDAGYEPPIICTPEELVGIDNDS